MTNPLLAQFVAEAADLLADVDAGLLDLERDPGNPELVNAVFRAAHTFKGSSGLFDLPAVTRVTHAAEDLLDAVRAGRLALDGDLVDLLLEAFDAVRGWMPAIEVSGRAPAGADDVADELAGRLYAVTHPDAAPAPGSGDAAGAPDAARTEAPLPAWLAVLPAARLARLADWLELTGASVRAVHYVPDGGCFFRGEDPAYLIRQVPAVEHLEIVTPGRLPGIADLDEYDCRLSFALLTRAAPAELAHVFRYVPDEVDVVEVTAANLASFLAGPPDDVPDVPEDLLDDAGRLLVTLLAAQRRAAAVLAADDGDEAGRGAGLESVLQVSRRIVAALEERLPGCSGAVGPQPVPPPVPGPGGPVDVEALLSWLDAVLARAAAPSGVGGLPRPRTPGETGEDTGPDTPGAEPGAGPGGAPGVPAPAGDGEHADARPDDVTAARVLKVEQTKVDRLLDLAGELVVAKNALPFLAAAAEDRGERTLARRIKDEYTVISRVSEELQQAVMDVRMLPVSTAFARAPRLVRDLARKLGKQVRLVQDGEDTAADKDVIEVLAEPLVHLVRNSLDHGIEPPDVREAAGKPPVATLTLSAFPDGDAVVVEVSDDGRGVDLDAVRRRAYERGLVDEVALASMPDDATAQLIFAPGFSTAERVSDVSGRGVGMDAVSSAVHRLGGSVAMRNRPGEGLTVRLRMPLTMAVTRVLQITASGQRFGVPIDDVIETVRVPAGSVTRVAGRGVLVLRDEVVPLAVLADLLDLGAPAVPAPDRDGAGTADVSVLVVRTPTGPLGIVVDRFHHDSDVLLKPLDGVLAGTAGYCGTALLGDGLVLLVLDVKELNARAVAAG